MVDHLKRMMEISDEVGDIREIDMGPWMDQSDRISIRGRTKDGKDFEMVLEIYNKMDFTDVDG